MSDSLFSSIECSAEDSITKLPLNEDVFQSVKVSDGSINSKFSQTFRNKASKNKLIDSIHPELNTHAKLFNTAAKRYASRPCLGVRKYDYDTGKSSDFYEYLSYNETFVKKNHIGAGIIRSLLLNKYLNPDKIESHKKVKNHLTTSFGIPNYLRDNADNCIEKSCSFILSIFAVNRVEWILADLACSSYSITSTALYDTLGSDVSQYILGLTQSPMVVCTLDKVEVLLKLKQSYPKETEGLISIVSMDPIKYVNKELLKLADQLNVEIQDLKQIENIGKSNPIEEIPPNPDSIFTISFTSGTTGSKPKGVMVPHRCASSYISFIMCFEPQAKEGDTAYIYLPLTHLYERQTSAFALSTGYALSLPQITLGKKDFIPFDYMLDDLRILKPTYMSIVPRLLTKLEGVIKNKIKELPQSEQIKVNEIIDYKIKEHGKFAGSEGFNAKYDSYGPYLNIQKFIGFENLRWVQTASAPVAATTIVYLKACLNMGLIQYYGLTESGAAITGTCMYDSKPGTSGSISPTGEYKLRSVPDMGYTIENLQGEVLLRGPQMFKGYYYNQEETNKAITEDGWFHTGDIATIDEFGRVSIIDRVKNFFKMAQGEYVSPEKIENKYLSANPLINQIFVHGNSLKSYLIGVVGIDYEHCLKFLNQEYGFNKIDMSQQELLNYLNEKPIKTKILNILNSNVKNHLNGFELLHNIHIEINPLTVEREVVTPTFKLRRPIAQKFFAEALHKLYEIEQSLIHGAKQVAKL
ncbi:FAA24 [Candida pseudojiufengensis]|uniref:FAA24 n=1 Tax=Candida pseudojiufengensis TaxID=497109 RepID=UPI002224BB34|nr:FAA24 [Candida pseudojiufengensis]KAI5967829.1 FAA24 [Candida pseudojiufengensis]